MSTYVGQSKFTYTPFTYKEYEKSQEVLDAEEKKTDAEKAIADYGQFQWADQDKYNALLQEYENRPDFSYDFNADALYQQYKDKYIQQGKMAMQDTMGQAAAMTGGYGNSYAQSVGQQAYQASLDNLNDIIPELYQMAYDRYNQEGQDLLNTITLLRGERDHEISMSNDEYAKLMDMLGYYSNEEQNAYNRGYTAHSDAQKYAYQAVADENAYNQALAQLGLSERQVALQEKQYEAQYGNSEKLYSGKTKTGASYNNGTLTTAQVKELQTKLGVEADGYYGEVSRGKAGDLSAEEAYEKYVGKIADSSNTDTIIENVKNYTTKQGQADYLAKLQNEGKISESEALAILAEHGVVELKDRAWEVVDDGGWNWFGMGIDADAKVRDEYGNEYSLGELRKELKKTMSTKEANKIIKEIEDELGI